MGASPSHSSTIHQLHEPIKVIYGCTVRMLPTLVVLSERRLVLGFVGSLADSIHNSFHHPRAGPIRRHSRLPSSHLRPVLLSSWRTRSFTSSLLFPHFPFNFVFSNRSGERLTPACLSLLALPLSLPLSIPRHSSFHPPMPVPARRRVGTDAASPYLKLCFSLHPRTCATPRLDRYSRRSRTSSIRLARRLMLPACSFPARSSLARCWSPQSTSACVPRMDVLLTRSSLL